MPTRPGTLPGLRAWASGFWQSKRRHLNQEELLELARECRAAAYRCR
jgi:hypothetical protein